MLLSRAVTKKKFETNDKTVLERDAAVWMSGSVIIY